MRNALVEALALLVSLALSTTLAHANAPDASPAVTVRPAPAQPAERHGKNHGHAHSGSDDATARHAFDDVEHWAKVFDDPARDAWQKPREVVAALALRPGATVVDLGAGTGYFAPHLSAAVGSDGSVLAADTEPALVEHLRARAEREGLANVVPILSSAGDPRLPAGAADVILIVDTYHHIDDRLTYLRRLKDGVKPGGRVAIVDWQKRDLPVGPAMDHKLAREQVLDEMTRSGYRLVDEPDLLPYQYFLVFTPDVT